jgi:hypothetical protein
MITVEQYAKKNKVSENSARKRLQRKVLDGYMFKMRGPDNRFVYHDKPLVTIKWHDPFNKIKLGVHTREDAIKKGIMK